MKPLDRFMSKIEFIPFHACWEWIGNRKPNGYGRIDIAKKSYAAHRLAYELFIGPIVRGLFVCHKCDNPSCVNPLHLFLGTHTDNMADRNAKGRGNMPKGVNHHKAKLRAIDIANIRASSLSSRKLATHYGVSHHNILCIRNRKTWKHV